MMFKTTSVIASLVVATSSLAEPIILKKDNVVRIRGEFNGTNVSKWTSAALSNPNKDILLYIQSQGGSILSGVKFIEALKNSGKHVTCIADFAASMAFVLLQNCDDRLVTEDSTLMQHVASVGLDNQPLPNQVSLFNYIRNIVDKLERHQAKRMGKTLDGYRSLIRDDYWVSGADAVKQGAADEVVTTRCDVEAVKDVEIETVYTMFGTVALTYSKCPLISNPIKIEFPRGAKEDVTPFMWTIPSKEDIVKINR